MTPELVTNLLAAGSGGIVGLVLGLVGGSILAVPLPVYVVGVASPHLAVGTSAIAVSTASDTSRSRSTRSKARHGTTKETIMTTKTAKDLVAEANRQVVTLSGEEAVKLIGNPEVVFVDVREGEELQKTGKVQGAVHAPRGFLEFQADPASPTHKPELGGGRRLVLYCASGNRSVLGAKALQDMGIRNVVHVAGGFGALQQAGAPIEGQP